MLGNMTPAQSLTAFEQVIALATVFQDDKFVSAMKEARKVIKQGLDFERELNEREKALEEREREALVIKNSQKRFNEQHSRAMVELDENLKNYQKLKDDLARDRTNFEARVAAEEQRLKDWESELKIQQNRVDKILKTEEARNAALASVRDKEEKLKARLAELGVREVA